MGVTSGAGGAEGAGDIAGPAVAFGTGDGPSGRTGSLFARNSLASLLRTSSGAFLALVLPPVLVRQLGIDAYGVWAIGVQVGTYLALLDFGSWSVVGHFGAAVHPPGDRVGLGRVVTTMLGLQTLMVLAGGMVLGALVAAMPAVYSDMPRSLIGPGRVALVLLGGSALVSLLVAPLSGYFLSIHRVIRPASITFASRLLAAVVVSGLALRGFGITGLAVAWAVLTVAGYVLIVVAYTRLHVPVRWSLLSWPLARQMFGFCAAYAIWVLAGLLVIGLDTVIVARIDFGAVAAYAAAAGAVSIVAAVYGSALAPFVPLSAQLALTGQRERLGAVYLRLSRWGGVGVVGASAVLAILSDPLLHAWLGGETAERGIRLFQVLLAANAVRLLLMPYPTLLFGTGEHRHIRFTPLIEGIVNIGLSVVLGIAIGPIGVALGTLVGAIVGDAVHLFVNLPRTRSLDLGPLDVLRESLLGPLLVAGPAVTVLALEPGVAAARSALAKGLAVGATLVLAWTVGLRPDDRDAVRRRARRALRRPVLTAQP